MPPESRRLRAPVVGCGGAQEPGDEGFEQLLEPLFEVDVRAREFGDLGVHGADVGGGVCDWIGPYQTAKWAVEGFSGVLQKEVAPLGIRVTMIEPGGFRTDWAGSSMTVHEIRPDYLETVGRMVEYRESSTPLGDPVKAAQAILAISRVPDPPLRLLLGSDAYTVARGADEAKIASDEKWEELTRSTDHDDSSFDPDELARATRKA